MNHAVEQEIVADAKENTYLLYIEVEPQPPAETKRIWEVCKGNSQSNASIDRDSDEWAFEVDTYQRDYGRTKPPISIGDTVYQGEEWWRDEHYRLYSRIAYDSIINTEPLNWQPPQTMPIELADKTFKVVGIGVELMGDISIPRMQIKSDGQWMWKYTLEQTNA